MVTITNCGDIATTYTASLPAGTTAYEIIGSPTSTLVAPGATYDYWVRFAPTTRGAQSSVLNVTGTGVAPMSIVLNGTGAGVSAAHNAFNIPLTAVGASQEFTVTVTNNGNIDWTTGTPFVSGAAFTTTSTGLMLAPGASGNITLTFAPTVIGSNSGTITFPNADPLEDPVFVINLNGTGTTTGSVSISAMNGFELEQNYPNPAATATTVRFTTPSTTNVTISIVDVKGEVVKNITSGNFPMGTHTVAVDASDLVAGTYFYVLASEGVQLSRQMTVVR